MDKVAVPLISLFSASCGGYGIWIIVDSPEPGWAPAAWEEDLSPYKGKYAEKYLNYLVSSSDYRNISWWSWSFNNRYSSKDQSTPTSKFKNLKGSLSEMCLEAYQTDTNQVDTTTSSSIDKFSESEIWKYCSHGGVKVKTIQDNSTSESYDASGAYGNKEENKSKLLAAQTTGEDDWFWETKEKLFFRRGEGNESSEKSAFRDLYKTYHAYTFEPKNKKLKEKCKEAYGKMENDEQYPKKDVFKFCSLAGKLDE